ncbi:MoaD/ThiS family protein [Seonamhaeicola maritimus]|uniref:MoaD/ThiS family protein n=1 Tax=Seonamhaeicola maritimus TaxID=2591822 RepID=A0A5C7GER3_9FLAO|nr:MoaD/ThiS family protein [Seonamhaeicola maritimus]TXG35343.1 MoaD/ThiS family protein [Seonamhaeicola maritimus]
MHIRIKYLGQIVEVTGKEEETLEVAGGQVSDLLDVLNSKYNQLKNKDFQIAQNQELVSLETELTGFEIALLPPFAGG